MENRLVCVRFLCKDPSLNHLYGFHCLPAEQKLEYQGSELQDGDSLGSYLISNNSIVQRSSNTLESLRLETFTGKTVPCSIELDAPVSRLQEMLRDKTGMPVGKKSPLTNGSIVDYMIPL
jgi:hypothetical protein